jgi:glycosyltransferase involved in cell wall biosynthesis
MWPPVENSSRLIVAVDLLPLRPGGENGGIKPAIFTLLRSVGEKGGDALAFVFLTNSASHAQVRQCARRQDVLVCVLEESEHPVDLAPGIPASEFKVVPPPPDLLAQIEADLLYCPFGDTRFHVSGLPTIALIADLLHKDYPFTLSAAQIAEREAYIQRTLSAATKIQCISRSGVERLIEHYHLSRDYLFYTYLPIHLRHQDATEEGAPRPETTAKRPFFFYPANLWLHKNHEILLVSYAQYWHSDANEPWDLVLTFHEEARAEDLRALARTLGIFDHVRFEGFVSESQLHQIWGEAGALVFPSLHEGFGIPLLEAMHYGVPIITSREFSLHEVAGDACYSIDPRKPGAIAKALLEVSSDSALRATLRRRGRERLQLFDLNVAVTSLWNAFRDVTRNVQEFPRKPRYCRQMPLLTITTPASVERWKIQIDFEAHRFSQKFVVYLDDCPFATISPDAVASGLFSFVCRPNGRLLYLRPAPRQETNESASDPISVKRIVATDYNGQRILLHQGAPPAQTIP